MDLGYLNSRVRGLRSRLVKRGDWRALLGVRSTGEVAELLSRTSYGPYIESARGRYEEAGEAVDSALSSSLEDSLGLVWKAAPRGAREMLRGAYSAWEAHNLKAVIRGISRGVDRDEILRVMLPAGEFTRPFVNALAHAGDLSEVLAFLKTWSSPYRTPVASGMESYQKDGTTEEMEIEVDRLSAQRALEALSVRRPWRSRDLKLMLGLTRARVDFINMMTLVKTCGQGFSAEGAGGFFVEGGGLGRKWFTGMLAFDDRGELLDELSGAGDGLTARVFSEADPEEPGLLEEAFEYETARVLERGSLVDPLGIALAAGYLNVKVREVKNLRLASRGAEFDIPEDELERFMYSPASRGPGDEDRV